MAAVPLAARIPLETVRPKSSQSDSEEAEQGDHPPPAGMWDFIGELHGDPA